MNHPLLQLLDGRRGHFELESGYHSEWWFDLDRLFQHPEPLRPFVTELAQRVAPYAAELVCGPMSGGAELAKLVGAALKVPHCCTERLVDAAATGLFPVRYKVLDHQRSGLRGKRVAIVDDAVSAGSAVRGTYADLIECGATPLVVGALAVFGDKAGRFASERNLALETLVTLPLEVWPPAECPLCRNGQQLEKRPAPRI